MLPILAAVLAFITIGGLGWVFVGGDDSSAQAVKRAQSMGEGKKNPALARKAAAAVPGGRAAPSRFGLFYEDSRSSRTASTLDRHDR